MCANEQQARANRKPSQSRDNLRYFLAVARTGTLSAAAEQLGTEHATLARHIHALEEELNSRLFHRSNSGYGLTEVGERLLAGAEAIESAYASAKAAASSEGQTIGADIEPRIRSTSVVAQLHATLSGSGLCVLPAFVAPSCPTLVPILPEKVSVLLSYHMHIHEDHRRAAHVREVAAFVAAKSSVTVLASLRQRRHPF
jgi:DNA-binding transcriptional LysR family regulator